MTQKLMTQLLLNDLEPMQVRALIVAVRLYTGRAVDVIAFSLGVPVSRKAILGGKNFLRQDAISETLERFYCCARIAWKFPNICLGASSISRVNRAKFHDFLTY